MLRAVIDTNVIVSGLLFGGLPFKILRAGFERKFDWLISLHLLQELHRVLSSGKFSLTKREVAVLVSPVLEVIEIIVPQDVIKAVRSCDADNRVLECAVEGACKVIVTGDRQHLLSLGQYRGIEIVQPRVFWEKHL
ncbi:MAG: putative toxin-antitoxin system toxin component, PIN family [Deltaproteobacteria bacterium]|nr:putative toxin-antitoxin system toxin component, PIN family [Deltaproteobacteria bacterium]